MVGHIMTSGYKYGTESPNFEIISLNWVLYVTVVNSKSLKCDCVLFSYFQRRLRSIMSIYGDPLNAPPLHD